MFAGPTLLLAHAGHWAFYIVYAVPVVVVVASVVKTVHAERIKAREGTANA